MKNSVLFSFFIQLLVLACLMVLPAAAMAQDTPNASAPGTVETDDLAPAPAPSAQAAPAAPAGVDSAKGSLSGMLSFPGQSFDMVKAGGAFVLVLVLLFLTLKMLGRFGRFKGTKGSESVIELRGIQALDNRKYLAVVEVEGHMIVVGVTQDNISPVAHWSVDDGLDFAPDKYESERGQARFKLPDETEDDHPAIDINIAEHLGDAKK